MFIMFSHIGNQIDLLSKLNPVKNHTSPPPRLFINHSQVVYGFQMLSLYIFLLINHEMPIFVFDFRPSGSAEGFTVRFGVVERSNNLPYEVEVDVSAIILHPEYMRTFDTLRQDMALLRFAETVEFSDYVRPICLATDTDEMTAYGSGNCMAAGWGATSQGNLSALCVFL